MSNLQVSRFSFFKSIKKASRQNADLKFGFKTFEKLRKSEHSRRSPIFPYPLQNRGSRVRILLPLPWCLVEIDPTEKKREKRRFREISPLFSRLTFFEFIPIHFRFFFESKGSNYRKRDFLRIEYGTQATGRTWTHDRVSNSSGFLRSTQNVYK